MFYDRCERDIKFCLKFIKFCTKLWVKQIVYSVSKSASLVLLCKTSTTKVSPFFQKFCKSVYVRTKSKINCYYYRRKTLLPLLPLDYTVYLNACKEKHLPRFLLLLLLLLLLFVIFIKLNTEGDKRIGRVMWNDCNCFKDMGEAQKMTGLINRNNCRISPICTA